MNPLLYQLSYAAARHPAAGMRQFVEVYRANSQQIQGGDIPANMYQLANEG